MARLAGGMRDQGSSDSFTIIHRTAPTFHAASVDLRSRAMRLRWRLLAVRDPDVLHLRSMVQEPAAFALFDAEPVDGPAFIAEDLLQIPHRQRLRNSTAGLACKRPDGVYIVMLRQDFQQLGASPGNQVDHTAAQVAVFKTRVKVATDQRESL